MDFACIPRVNPDAVQAPKRVAVYGATGCLGQLVTTRLIQAGHRVVIGGRNERAINQLYRRLDVADAFVVNVDQTTLLTEFVDQTAVVVNCAGPSAIEALLRAATRVSADVVDATPSHELDESLRSRLDGWARRNGIAIVTSAGFFGLLGDLLAAAACADWQNPESVLVESCPEGTNWANPERNPHSGAWLTSASLRVDVQRRGSRRQARLIGEGVHELTAAVIAEVVRLASRQEIYQSGIVSWRAFVPEQFLEALPLTDLTMPFCPGRNPALLDDIIFS
jgi:NAD(P)-dependent dehydrogenase (short-subunit alcohol dehydrogenase family)